MYRAVYAPHPCCNLYINCCTRKEWGSVMFCHWLNVFRELLWSSYRELLMFLVTKHSSRVLLWILITGSTAQCIQTEDIIIWEDPVLAWSWQAGWWKRGRDLLEMFRVFSSPHPPLQGPVWSHLLLLLLSLQQVGQYLVFNEILKVFFWGFYLETIILKLTINSKRGVCKKNENLQFRLKQTKTYVCGPQH